MAKKAKVNTKSLYFSQQMTTVLNQISEYPLTIVEAPMGYGKTTAVKVYLQNRGTHLLWQTVYDNVSGNFWSGFAGLFAEIDVNCASGLARLGLPDDSVSRQEAVRLIAKAPLPGETVLVIDDYYLADHPDIHQFIAFLVKNEIPDLHIVLTTRVALFEEELDEMQLKGYVCHIGKETLALDAAGIINYYKACGLAIRSDQAERLYAYSEGWISALYLLMLDFVKKGGFSEAEICFTNIYSLVANAVYWPLTAEKREFLLKVCIFDSFTEEQAAALWSKPNIRLLLKRLLARNAFISCDVQCKNYSLHYILKSFLREQLQSKEPAYRDDLYRRAAQWQYGAGDYPAAMENFYLCGDFEALLTTLERAEEKFYTNEHKKLLIKYMEECPEPIRSRHHRAMLLYAFRLYAFNERELLKKTCAEFRQNLRADPEVDSETKDQLQSEYELLDAIANQREVPLINAALKKSCSQSAVPVKLVGQRGIWTFGTVSVLYMFYRKSGQLQKYIEIVGDAASYYSQKTGGFTGGTGEVLQAEYQYYRGNLEAAEILSYRALAAIRVKRQPGLELCAAFLQLRLAFLKDDFSLAWQRWQALREEIIRRQEYAFLHALDLCESFLYLAIHQPEQVPEWLKNGEFTSGRLLFPIQSLVNSIYGRLLLEKGEDLKLIGLIDSWLSKAAVFPHLLAQIYHYIHLAGAKQRIGHREDARQDLRRALEIALPDQVYLPFAENGDYIRTSLQELRQEGFAPDVIEKILKLDIQYQQAADQIAAVYHSKTKSRLLTRRETEIAALAAEGLTNSEIGTRLFISANTVKKALLVIFGKLDISSRTQLSSYLTKKEF